LLELKALKKREVNCFLKNFASIEGRVKIFIESIN